MTGIRVGARQELKEYDAVVAALDLPGIKNIMPESFRKFPMFDDIYKLDCVPIATVQVRRPLRTLPRTLSHAQPTPTLALPCVCHC